MEAAKHINDFFTNIAAKLDTKNTPWIDTGVQTDNSFNLRCANMTELKEIISNIEVAKSSGVEHLSCKVLKDAFSSVPHVLLHIMNLSIATATVPDSWKQATILPLEKVTNATSASDFRPISLLPLPGKILERVVSNQMTGYLESNNLLSENQSGYRSKHSTIATISDFTDEVHAATDLNQLTLAVFIHFRKAFDCVDHTILKSKLTNLGFSPPTIKWFNSYLSKRTQRTLANQTLSDYQTVQSGVPQGSILGPILFLVYVNDIPTSLKHSRHKLYADDTLIYLSSDNNNNSCQKLTEDMSALDVWCDQNKMHINYKKNKFMCFGSQYLLRNSNDLTVALNMEPIEKVQTYKYLGVTMDEQLTFNNHVQKTIQSASHKLYLLRKVRSKLNPFAALQIYKAMILPVIEYGNVLYDTANNSLLAKLQVIQNKCLKVVQQMPKLTPSAEMHVTCKMKPLGFRRRLNTLVHAYNRSFKSSKIDQRSLTTRTFRARALKCPPSKKNLTQKAVAYRTARLWNGLLPAIRNKNTVGSFKRSVLSTKTLTQLDWTIPP